MWRTRGKTCSAEVSCDWFWSEYLPRSQFLFKHSQTQYLHYPVLTLRGLQNCQLTKLRYPQAALWRLSALGPSPLILCQAGHLLELCHSWPHLTNLKISFFRVSFTLASFLTRLFCSKLGSDQTHTDRLSAHRMALLAWYSYISGDSHTLESS